MQLKVERRDGRLAATYLDKSLPPPDDPEGNTLIPVTDLYDFGGGFYFTLLLGHQGHSMLGGSRDMGPGYGWLVGEAAIQDGALNGTIAFYPYALGSRMTRVRPGQPDTKPELQTGRRDWQAKRIAP